MNLVRVYDCLIYIQFHHSVVHCVGYVCPYASVMPSSCCDPDHAVRFECNSCLEHGCCAVYEHCVSCCLHPQKVFTHFYCVNFIAQYDMTFVTTMRFSSFVVYLECLCTYLRQLCIVDPLLLKWHSRIPTNNKLKYTYYKMKCSGIH